MASDVLIELGTEELPSGSVWPLAEALAVQLQAGLDNAKLAYGAVAPFATPRRIAVLIRAVDEEQACERVTKRGPSKAAGLDAQGLPTQALRGFAASCGVAVDALSILETDKGAWWVYESLMQGLQTFDLLPGIMTMAVSSLPISKRMRWGAGDIEFVRPVHWVVALMGERVLPFELLGVQTGRLSVGHRFHHPETISISSPDAYEAALMNAFVLPDFAKRRQCIVEQIQSLAAAHACEAIMPDALLDEVTSIVEWPTALLCSIDPIFLQVPSEALIASMQSHQKCFAVRDASGELRPYFITVSNIQSTDPQTVCLGNEKVMRARLSDAAFFFDRDKKNTLIRYRDLTKQVVFQEKLGTLADKSDRIQALMQHLTGPLGLDSQQALRASLLSKCDLMTGMVGEFPELQGVMGSYYARHDGEVDAVACALVEQYKPRFSTDTLPESLLGQALSLADRVDTLVGSFSIGQKPTGMKDPYKLRRHALAVARLLIAMPAVDSLSTLIEAAYQGYGDGFGAIKPPALEALKPFILDRLFSFYQAKGIAADRLHAVRARQDEWLFDFDKRLYALLAFIQHPDAVALSAACKRVNNIMQQSNHLTACLQVDVHLFESVAERQLYDHLQRVEEAIRPYYVRFEYGLILSELASLRASVDVFFNEVMVMVDNLTQRENRFALLRQLQSLLQGVADIALLQ